MRTLIIILIILFVVGVARGEEDSVISSEAIFVLDGTMKWIYEDQEFNSFKDVIQYILIDLDVPINMSIYESQKIKDKQRARLHPK